MAVKTTVNQCC